MDSFIHRFKRSLAMRGLVGTFQMAGVCVLAYLLPGYRRVEAQRKAADAAFDAEYACDTGGIFRPSPDSVKGDNWEYGITYQAVDPRAFETSLRRLNLQFEEFTFVDFGSGKGRALLLASKLPFRKVIGVEYCEELNAVARENVSRLPKDKRTSGPIEIVSADATLFEVPVEPLVLYFYNPFGEPVMAKVVENVVNSWRRAPRRIIIVYFTPYFAHLWQATGVFNHVGNGNDPVILDAGVPPHTSLQEVTKPLLVAQ